jgi:hypothetical protein
MFLFRMLFWIVIVILILPAPRPSDEGGETGSDVTVTRAVGAARATVSDMAGFCQRNSDVCETGRAVFSTFWAKARYGAQLLAEVVSGAGEGDDKTPTDGAVEAHDTLTPDDLVPAWRGPTAGDA